MHPFSDFTKYLSHTKLKDLYKKALFSALKVSSIYVSCNISLLFSFSLQEAAKRCSKDIGNKTDDRKSSWIFHSSFLTSLTKTMTSISSSSCNVREENEETPLNCMEVNQQDNVARKEEADLQDVSKQLWQV